MNTFATLPDQGRYTEASTPALDPPPQLAGVVAGRWDTVESALEHLPEGIAVLDASLRVVAWNRPAAAITGYPAAAAVGGVCLLEDDVLTLVPDGVTPCATPPPPEAFDRWFWRFQVKGLEGVLPSAGATVIRLGHEDLAFFVHFVRADALEGPGTAAPAGPTGAIDALTPREREILRLLAAGKTAKPIATHLAVSVPTVRTHIRHILRKLGVHSSLEAAVSFLRAGGALLLALAIGLAPSVPAL